MKDQTRAKQDAFLVTSTPFSFTLDKMEASQGSLCAHLTLS